MLSCGRFALALRLRARPLRVGTSDARYALGLTGGSEPCTDPDTLARPCG